MGEALRRRASAFRFRELTLVPAIIIAILAGALISDAFLTTRNFLNILQQSSELSVLVIAEALILIAGKFDLSLESTVALPPMLAAWLIVSDTTFGGSGIGLNVYLAIAVLFATGALIGFANGFLVVRLRLNAFIVTLAMLILLRGVTLGITNGKTLFDLPSEFLYLGSGKWLGVPVSIWIAGILYLIVGLFLRYHRTGRAI
jgi:ribose/xylose/arabinose/galactoside ABC-type transport system permease subunit